MRASIFEIFYKSSDLMKIFKFTYTSTRPTDRPPRYYEEKKAARKKTTADLARASETFRKKHTIVYLHEDFLSERREIASEF